MTQAQCPVLPPSTHCSHGVPCHPTTEEGRGPPPLFGAISVRLGLPSEPDQAAPEEWASHSARTCSPAQSRRGPAPAPRVPCQVDPPLRTQPRGGSWIGKITSGPRPSLQLSGGSGGSSRPPVWRGEGVQGAQRGGLGQGEFYKMRAFALEPRSPFLRVWKGRRWLRSQPCRGEASRGISLPRATISQWKMELTEPGLRAQEERFVRGLLRIPPPLRLCPWVSFLSSPPLQAL